MPSSWASNHYHVSDGWASASVSLALGQLLAHFS